MFFLTPGSWNRSLDLTINSGCIYFTCLQNNIIYSYTGEEEREVVKKKVKMRNNYNKTLWYEVLILQMRMLWKKKVKYLANVTRLN